MTTPEVTPVDMFRYLTAKRLQIQYADVTPWQRRVTKTLLFPFLYTPRTYTEGEMLAYLQKLPDNIWEPPTPEEKESQIEGT